MAHVLGAAFHFEPMITVIMMKVMLIAVTMIISNAMILVIVI